MGSSSANRKAVETTIIRYAAKSGCALSPTGPAMNGIIVYHGALCNALFWIRKNFFKKLIDK
jgi:hypothetical protein